MNNKHEVIIKVEGKEWQEALDKSFNKNIKKIKIDGFREGKAPREVYERKYGKESLYMDAVDFVLPNAYKRALDESKLIPVIQPSIDIKKVDNKEVEIIFVIISKPEVKIKKYKKLKVEKPKLEVTKEEVEQEIKSLQNKYAEIVLKDGAIQNGDTAVIDFEGYKDGVQFEGGKGENYPLEIGSKTFIPGFEEQLVGLKAGEEKDVEVTFPKDYPSEDLKGKKVTFKVKVHEIKTKVIPELNETFFQDLDMENVTNKEQLYESLKNEIEKRKEINNENVYIDNILAAISKEVDIDIPEEMIDEEIHRMMHQYEERLKMQGLTLEQYFQFTNSSHDKFHEQFEEEAKKVITYRLMIERIAELENIKATEEDAKEEAKKLADKYQMEEEDLVKAFGGLDMIKYDVEMRRTMDFLKENN